MNNAAEGRRLRGQGSFPLSLRFLATQKFPRAAGWGRSDGTGNDMVISGQADDPHTSMPSIEEAEWDGAPTARAHDQFVIVDLCLGADGADGGVREKLCPPVR